MSLAKRHVSEEFMLQPVLENGGVELLVLLVLVAIAILHILLFREYLYQDKIQKERLKAMEKLVNSELFRSKSLTIQVDKLASIKERTQDQLDLIKLELEAIKLNEDPKLGKKNKQ